MEKKGKIILGIVLGIGAGIGIYFGIKKLMKPKGEAAEGEAKPEDKTVTQQISVKPGSALNIKKSAPKVAGFGNGNQPAPKTNVSLAKPKTKNQPQSKGDTQWAYARMDGVKTYKQSSTKGVSIGPLYNTYNQGKIIGKVYGSNSVGGEKWLQVKDGANSILVSDKLVYTKII